MGGSKLLAAGLLGLLIPAVCQGEAEERPQRPGIVFILVDDLGARDLGCTGSTFYETPHLDRLAATGIRFTAAYAACPVCSPTRAAILTGKYPTRVGITDWIPGANPRNRKLLGTRDLHALPLEEITLAESLADAGYRTFFAGKWHLGSRGHFPEDQGFDVNKGGHEKGSPPGGYYTPYRNPKLEDGPPGEYLTDRLTSESIRFLEDHVKNHGESPFLLYLSFYTVHTPIQPCRRHLETFQEKAAKLPETSAPAFRPERNGQTRQRQDRPDYATMVHAMDENVGRILDALDALDLSRKTAVFFTSDNGGLSTLRKGRNPPTSNLPLRAGKGWCYEGGIRVPLIIRVPGVTEPGSTSGAPVISMDFYPTILELARLPLRPGQHVDGVSLLPLLRGGKDIDRKAIFWHYPHYHGSTWAPGAAIRAGDWKLVEFYEEGTTELYRLSDDPGERDDLSGEHPEKKAELVKMLRGLQERTGARMPEPNPDYREKAGE